MVPQLEFLGGELSVAEDLLEDGEEGGGVDVGGEEAELDGVQEGEGERERGEGAGGERDAEFAG
jgi:hypothetical protein